MGGDRVGEMDGGSLGWKRTREKWEGEKEEISARIRLREREQFWRGYFEREGVIWEVA